MNNDIKSLKIKNYHLFFIHQLLNRPLNPNEARARNKFYILTKDRVGEVEKERIEIVKQNDKSEKADELYTEIMKEDFIIDVLPSTEPILKQIKIILEGATRELNITEGALFDEIMNAFESI